MNTKIWEKPLKVSSPEAIEWSDWQNSIYQPPPGKLVKQHKNDGAGANVISDESIRVPVPLETGTQN